MSETTKIDTLAAVPVRTVTSAQLRRGMILVDEFDTPVARLVERIRTVAGCAEWTYSDLETNNLTVRSTTFPISRKATIRVAA